MFRLTHYLVALTLVAVSGLWHGLWTDRWARSQDDAASHPVHLDASSLNLGDWKGRDDSVDARQLERAGISSYAMRRYVQERSGAQVSVLLVGGRGGPIAVHTPEVCYAGRGYQTIGAVERRVLRWDGDAAEFFRADFGKPQAPLGERVRIYWSWNVKGQWKVADNPRLAFAHYPSLHKLYLIQTAPGKGAFAEAPVLDLWTRLAPEVTEGNGDAEL
jgi:hypothetical protein